MSEIRIMVITITGNNHFLITQKLKEFVSKFAGKYSDLAVEKIDGEEAELESIKEALQNLPFLIQKKLVILRDPSKNKKFVENIEQIISSIPETTDAVIYESKLDRRGVYYKVLKTKTDLRELNELDETSLTNWVAAQVKSMGGEISRSDARYLVERVGASQELLFNEVGKLLNYQKNITKDTIDLLTEPNPQNTIFDLLDSAFSGKAHMALKLYEQQRRQKVEPLSFMALLAWQLHILAVIKAAGTRSQADIAKTAKINPFVVRKNYALSHKLSLIELKKFLDEALKLDVRLKSQTIDADDAMKHFLLSLSS